MQGKFSINGTTITATNVIPSMTHDSGLFSLWILPSLLSPGDLSQDHLDFNTFHFVIFHSYG